jgi:ubiquinone/menaquinone biosynthesis C-methylase UbiE
MSEAGLQAQIDAANAYEALFVPALFQQWTARVVDAAQIQPGQRVLDVACGTGILAREVASRTGPTGSVVGLDLSPRMLAVAERLAPVVDWRQSAAESLPFPDESFDAVVSQFGLMFFTDGPRAFREMLRVLRPGGCLAVAAWDSLDNIPAYATELALLDRVAGRRASDALHHSCSVIGRIWPRCLRRLEWPQPKSRPITAWRSFRAFERWSKPTSGAGCR